MRIAGNRSIAVVLAALLQAAGAGAAEDLEPTPRADALYERGARALRQGDVPAALVYLARAYEQEPHDASVLSAYAQALVAAGRNQEAREVLEGMEGGPAGDLGEGLVRYQLGEWDAAAQSLRRALDAEPRNATAHLYLAAALIELGELDAAERHLERAEQLDPALAADVAFRRGHIALARGDRRSAEEQYARVEQLAPGSALARAAARQRGADRPVGRRWSVYGTLGAGWDSNVNLAGQDPVLLTDREDDVLAFAEVGGHYDAVQTDRFSLRVGGTVFMDYHQDEHDFDLLTTRAWTVAALTLTPELTLDARYTFEYIWTDFREFRRTHAAEPSLRWRAREDLLTRAFFRFEDRDYFTETETFPGFALPPGFPEAGRVDPLDRDGQLLIPGVEQYWFFPDWTGWGRGFVRLGYRHRRENTEGSEADASGHIGNLMLGLPLPAELFLLAEGEYEWRHYSHPSVIGLLTRDELGRRKEKVTRARVALRRPLTEHLTGELGYRYTNWLSNVDFYEFDRHNVYALATYRY